MAIDRQRIRGEQAIESVLAQPGIGECEVLLFDFGFADFAPPKSAIHPSVTYLPMRRGMTLGRWKKLAIEMSQAPIVAFLEEHAIAGTGWLPAIREAFLRPIAGVGGPAKAANPGQGISDLVTWMFYPRFIGPFTSPQQMPLLPGHNSAYRRDILLANRDSIESLFSSESLFQTRLVEQGYRLEISPDVIWFHRNEVDLPTVMNGIRLWNQMAGGAFAAKYSGPLWKLFWGMRFALMPVLRTLRMHWQARHHPSSIRTMLLRSTPTVLAVNIASAVGLATGYFLGTGDSQERFFDHEMNAERGL